METYRKSGTLIETREFKVPKSIGPKNKSKSKSKGIRFDREIVSAEKKIMADIQKYHCNEKYTYLVELSADNAIFTFFKYFYMLKI